MKGLFIFTHNSLGTVLGVKVLTVSYNSVSLPKNY